MVHSTLLSIITTLLSTALAASATPVTVKASPFSVSLSQQSSPDLNAKQLLQQDHLRVRAMLAHLGSDGGGDVVASDYSVPTQDYKGLWTVARVNIGQPSTQYDLMVDTASAFTWIGANKNYSRNDNTVGTPETFKVNNTGAAPILGDVVFERLSLNDDLVVQLQAIGIAHEGPNMRSLDGVLGLGLSKMTIGILSPSKEMTVPTVLENLKDGGKIPSTAFGLSFVPTTDGSDVIGSISWGRLEDGKYNLPLAKVNVTKKPIGQSYWAIEQSICYGDSRTPILNTTSGIMDVGVTFLMITPKAFESYKNVTKAEIDEDTKLLYLPNDKISNLQTMHFQMGDINFEYPPDAQIFPKKYNTDIKGKPDRTYLIVQSLPDDAEDKGIGFVNGYSFHKRYYTYYDTDARQLGIANTPFTSSAWPN